MTYRIHILGASGSGTTTLGQALAGRSGCRHFDTDDYFWLPTNPPFQEKRPTAQRVSLLRQALASEDGWVLSGSLCGWGDVFAPMFTLVVFLWLPSEVRLERLLQRERLRYGEAVLPGGDRYDDYGRFMAWAATYDEGGVEMRSLQQHERWLDQVACPVVRIDGDRPIEESVSLVFQHTAAGARRE